MNTIRLLFWNVWCLPSLFTDGMASDDRAKAILPFIQNYDVVILNEAWTKSAKAVFKTVYPYHYTTGKKCCKIFDSGLMILSNHPILKPSYLLFSDASNWDWFASKGVMNVKIPINGVMYNVFTTHLQAGYSMADHRTRMSQINELTTFVNSKADDGEQVLLIGDFNVMPLVNGVVSVHCKDYNDAVRRSHAYYTIGKDTGLFDMMKDSNLRSVYHVFVQNHLSNSTIAFHNNNITDGPFFTVNYTPSK